MNKNCLLSLFILFCYSIFYGGRKNTGDTATRTHLGLRQKPTEKYEKTAPPVSFGTKGAVLL